MTKEKQLYVSPETEALVIRFEGVVCTSGGQYGSSGYAGSELDEDGPINL